MRQTHEIRKERTLYITVFLLLLGVATYMHGSKLRIRLSDVFCILSLVGMLQYNRRIVLRYSEYCLIILGILAISQMINYSKMFALGVAYIGFRYWFMAFVGFVGGYFIVEFLSLFSAKKALSLLFIVWCVYGLLYSLAILNTHMFCSIFSTELPSDTERLSFLTSSLFFISVLILKIKRQPIVHWILISSLFLVFFIVSQSRQALFTFIAIVFLLNYSISDKIISRLAFPIVLTSVLWDQVFMFLSKCADVLLKNNKLADRLSDMTFVWSSGAVLVRWSDVSYTVNEVFAEGISSILLGFGVGFRNEIERIGGFTDYLRMTYTTESYVYYFGAHSPDFTPALLLIDGGLLLLLVVSIITTKVLMKIRQTGFNWFIVSLVFILMNAIPSTHMITSFGLILFISTIYFLNLSMSDSQIE